MTKGHASNAWNARYTFEDANAIAGGITQSFRSFWQSECDSMKEILIEMDTQGTGRVPLTKLYNKSLDSDWRFGESEAYLRDLGVIDDSSAYLGPQVIIPNYIHATSNCIVSTPHYLVCCPNHCEEILGDIEAAVQAPTASTKDILTFVANQTAQITIDKEHTPELGGKLTELLEEVA